MSADDQWRPPAPSIPPGRTVDTVTVAEWNGASRAERASFLRTARHAGYDCDAGCPDCGYRMQAGACAACTARGGPPSTTLEEDIAYVTDGIHRLLYQMDCELTVDHEGHWLVRGRRIHE